MNCTLALLACGPKEGVGQLLDLVSELEVLRQNIIPKRVAEFQTSRVAETTRNRSISIVDVLSFT